MVNDLEKKKLILEIRGLVDGIENVKDEVNIYCEMMKQMFLSGSATN